MFLARELPTAPRPACQNESADVGVVGVRARGLVGSLRYPHLN